MKILEVCLNKLLRTYSFSTARCFVVDTLRNISELRYGPLKGKDTHKEQFDDLKRQYFVNRNELEPTQWQIVREILINKFKYINDDNIDAIIIKICADLIQLDLAKNYINYLTYYRNNEPNDATLAKLLKIYNDVYHTRGGLSTSLTKNEQNDILSICDRIKAKYRVLDSVLCESLIIGLVTTDRWRESLELLDMFKITSTPTLLAYSELAIKAFEEEDFQLGWRLIDEMIFEQRIQPKCEVLLSSLRAIFHRAEYNYLELQKNFESFLKILEKHSIILTERVAEYMEKIALKYPELLIIKRSQLTSNGECLQCHQRMENNQLNITDFQKLQNAFHKQVLVGNDIFQKSTPQEVEGFRKYVAQTAPYDCVIDGLNVAYSMGNKKSHLSLAELLKIVVRYFVERRKKVLVLGREHMENWPKKPMQYIKDNANIFLANDLSHDDPFLLYAALISGPMTNFFSRDLMRQHAFLLGPQLKPLFRRWQQTHQHSLQVVLQNNHNQVVVNEPIRFLVCAHHSHNRWHLPFRQTYTVHVSDKFEVPKYWLCLELRMSNIKNCRRNF